MSALEQHTRRTRAAGRQLLATYVTGGITSEWTEFLRSGVDAGADLFEVGLPFSDPMLDGPTIQQASDRALERGVTADSVLSDVRALNLGVPLVAMTYANLVFTAGAGPFCERLRDAGFAGLIVPDVPLSEVDELSDAAESAGIDLVLLVAPSAGSERRKEIARRSRGFVYAVSAMATTGEREELEVAGAELALDLRQATELPILLGFGISGAAQVSAASRYADGVVVASTLMRTVLDGGTASEFGTHVAQLRAALDTTVD